MKVAESSNVELLKEAATVFMDVAFKHYEIELAKQPEEVRANVDLVASLIHTLNSEILSQISDRGYVATMHSFIEGINGLMIEWQETVSLMEQPANGH